MIKTYLNLEVYLKLS